MGFLKNMVSNAISEGVGKGIQNAVGKAVESAVRPAADKLAGEAAKNLNQASQEIAQSTESMKSAAAEGAEAVRTSEQEAGQGFANLGAALSGWASTMQNVAGQVAQNMKECPNCGEVAPAENKFCPKCGAPLPEETIGAGYLCPKCGKQNVPGTTYCVECGTILPAVEAANAKQLAKWDELLPQYPKWTLRGTLELEENDEMNGYPSYRLSVDGAGRAELTQYIALLTADGFIPAFDGDSDVYYKVVDGVCRAFDKTDYDSAGGLSVGFFVGDYDKRAAQAQKAKADAAAAAAKDTAKAAADVAKGLFKKFF